MDAAQERLQIAKSVDLTDVARALGYTVVKVGRYFSIKEMDSIRIYDRKNWYRFSRPYDKGNNGGSQIDFLRAFAGLGTRDAIDWLVDFSGRAVTSVLRPEEPKTEKRALKLPPRAMTYSHLYGYLLKERALSVETVDFFVKNYLIYEEALHHNIVFEGKDKTGSVRFASVRGTYDKDGHGFRCDISGSNKLYGFNLVNEASETVVVFEAAIDMMSYFDLFGNRENMVALGMLSDGPLETFLNEHPNVGTIRFCLDNDAPGREATEKLSEKYFAKGYDVELVPIPEQYKDMNEYLKAIKESVELVKAR